MQDYGPLALGQAGNSLPREQRPMDQIKAHADYAYQLAARVQGFLDRFHGEGPKVAGGQQADITAPIQISYANAFGRLNANLETLASNITALEQIG